MSGKTADRSKWRRRKWSKTEDDRDSDNDCASLAWLLNFRLDEFVNLRVPDDEPERAVKEPKLQFPDSPPSALKKPPYTYPELIERALRENGELTVSAIYQWISDRFPYYKANDERWKNSIRHNLSINPHFRKGARAPQGAGHLWSLDANAIDLLPCNPVPEERARPPPQDTEMRLMGFQKRRLPKYRIPKPLPPSYFDFLPYTALHVHEEKTQTLSVLREAEVNIMRGFPKVIVLDEAAIAAASILPDQDLYTGGTMFLNPVSTEQVVRECGLITVD